MEGVRRSTGIGGVMSVSVSQVLTDGTGTLPFFSTVSGTVAVSASRAGTRPEGTTTWWVPVDARLTAVIGKTLFDRINPYVGVTVFGGPILYARDGHTLLGTDRFKFQVPLGLSLGLPNRWDAFIEGSPVGERSLAIGFGRSF